MAPPLTPITNLNGAAIGVLNGNNEKLKSEFGKTFYRDGSVNMDGPIDMDGNRVINVGPAVDENDLATIASIRPIVADITKGPTGPANSTYTTLADLKNAPATNKSYILASPSGPILYSYVSGNFSAANDEVNVVALNSVPLTTGALVKQSASSMVVQRADSGALPVSLLDRLMSAPRTPIDFGLTGSWTVGSTTDDTPKLQLLLNSAFNGRRGVMPLQDGIFYINQQLIIPEDCGLDGGLSAGEPAGRSFGFRRATLVCGPSGSVRCDRGSTLRNINVVKSACAVIPTTTAQANAIVAAYSGTGITINGADVLLDRPTIVGFNTGILSFGNERPTILGARIDCLNGIDIGNCFDTGRCHDAQIWPFFTAHITGLDSSVLLRSGTAINLHDTADGFILTDTLSYGYAIGIRLENVYGVKLSNFWIDGVIATQATQMASGIVTRGNVVNCGFSNGHVDSQSSNYNFGHTGDPGLMVVGCTGGGFSDAQIVLGSGSGGNIVGFQSTGGLASAIGEVNVLAGIGSWVIGFFRIRNSAAPKIFAYQNAGDASQLRTHEVFVTNGPADDRSLSIYIPNNVPLSNPIGGGYLYVESGSLKYRGPSGAITTLGTA